MTIDPPNRPIGHPDRGLDREEAMEPAFQDLARRAEAAGWSGDELAAALLSLAQNHILGRAAEAEMDAAIARLRRSN